MSTDILPQPLGLDQPGDRQRPTSARWWIVGLLAIGAVAVVASAAALIPDTSPSREIGPLRTHTITRGDLTVSVTEQGTLESAENTEIKCQVRGYSTVIWVIEGGTEVEPGDELVRLDTLAIEDAIAERTKYAHLVRSGAERAKADVARAELAIPEYLEGRYRTELMTLEKDLAIGESNLRTAQDTLDYVNTMFERGYVSDLEVERKEFQVAQAELNVEVKQTEIDVLKRFTKSMELETLKGDLNAAKARYEAEAERARMDAERRDLALEELGYCVIKAERSGLVIHPSAARWKRAPEIEEGSTVHKDQILLLMPDLSKMQVKVGIHESMVDRVRPGLAAKISLPEKTLDGEVSAVALVTRPAGWWTGNVVKYDTIVKLPSVEGLKPGMSAEVEVILDRHEDVLIVPVAAVVETAEGDFCWVKTADGVGRRSLRLGDTDDAFIVVESGLQEGEEVVLDPLTSIEEAQSAALKPFDEAKLPEARPEEPPAETQPTDPEADHAE
jgi:multidrug efflux pump subunit AcrA (membrane-fusion protein)